MNFTAKEDYGLRAVVYIALNRSNAPIQAHEVAASQNIPEQFLEQVLAILRRAGIIRSIRGASGGYDLARPAEQIAIGDILRALSGPILPVQCVNEDEPSGCPEQVSCSVAHFWIRLKDAVSEVVDGTTVQDLIDYQMKMRQAQTYMMNI
ncbi:MAG: Rrf2 family transcriptional regulator [Armatimonadetes bacterium]|nr:Rrf2 family transcriptional regulator [Armatimonadota bacterium]